MTPTEKDEILSLSKDLGEIGLDSLMEDGLFKDIPFIGSGISVIKLMNSVSDRILLTKIIHFINNLDLKNQEEIEEFKKKYFKEKDYNKIGSKLLLILEKADNSTKIEWLSISLKLFINKSISKSDFLRIASIINSGYVEDIEQISIFTQRTEITSTNDLIESYILDHLFSIGLLESHGFDGGDISGNNSGTIYGLNRFGKIFSERIIKNYPQH